MKKINTIFILCSLMLLAENTVEDLTAEPVENLAPFVITIPVVEDEESNIEVQGSDEVSFETVNGNIQKNITKSSGSKMMKEDEEVEFAEGIEPRGIDNL